MGNPIILMKKMRKDIVSRGPQPINRMADISDSIAQKVVANRTTSHIQSLAITRHASRIRCPDHSNDFPITEHIPPGLPDN